MEKVARKEKVPDTTTVTQTIAMMRVLLFISTVLTIVTQHRYFGLV